MGESALGGPRVHGEDMFMMWCIGRHKLVPKANLVIIVAYNKMHVGFFFKNHHLISFVFNKV
jgi:hypothetical protein